MWGWRKSGPSTLQVANKMERVTTCCSPVTLHVAKQTEGKGGKEGRTPFTLHVDNNIGEGRPGSFHHAGCQQNEIGGEGVEGSLNP